MLPIPMSVPNCPLLTRTAFVLPTPTDIIFIISSPILMRSDPKYDCIPLILIILSTVVTLVESPVVCDVETIGD